MLDKLKGAGVTWVRIDTSWAGIEASAKGDRNAWYLRMVDFCVNAAHQRGIKVLMTLWLTPAWANGGRGERVPPTNPADYGDFARWAAKHWKSRVNAWEVWNEPDPSQTFWQGTTSQYVDLLKAAYPKFKAGDPSAPVILGGPSSNDDTWIDSVYSLGAKGSFDVLATHPYQGLADAPPEYPDDGNRWWLTHTPAVRNVMAKYGDDGKPIWFTEFGWSAHDNWAGIQNRERGVTPAQQGEYFVRAIKYTRANYPYVPVMFWYKERAQPGSTNGQEEGYALLNPDLTERPVYSALKSFLVERVVVRDRAGDPDGGNDQRYPARRDLDLLRIVVERRGNRIRIVWETAEPATRSIIYTFNAYNASGNEVAAVEVRLRGDRSIRGLASKSPGSYANAIPGALIRFRGRQLIVDVPPAAITYARRFHWRAATATIGRAAEVRDDVPNAGKSILNPPSAKFP